MLKKSATKRTNFLCAFLNKKDDSCFRFYLAIRSFYLTLDKSLSFIICKIQNQTNLKNFILLKISVSTAKTKDYFIIMTERIMWRLGLCFPFSELLGFRDRFGAGKYCINAIFCRSFEPFSTLSVASLNFHFNSTSSAASQKK